MSLVSIGTVAVAGYSAYSSNKAKNDAVDSAQAQNDAIASQMATVEGNIQGLLDGQTDPRDGLIDPAEGHSNPTDLFKEIFTQYPDLLAQVLPGLTNQAIGTSSQITNSNVANFQSVLSQLYPAYGQMQQGQVNTINSLDPNNLGQEEILAQARMIAPLIPAGTLDPKTGSVGAGTTSPVSLYRNLISGMYNDRRTQYLGEVNNYLSNAENSAARQQSSAESFLGTFLNGVSGTSQFLTGATLDQEQFITQAKLGQEQWSTLAALEQEQFNTGNQYNLLNTLLKIPTASVNTAAYDQATASSIQSAISALGTGYAKSTAK